MKLVIDSNIIFSALISPSGKTCELIFSNNIELFAPNFLLEELKKYEKEILKKSKLEKEDLDLFLTLISKRIQLVPIENFKKDIKKAEKICPDPKDTEFFALALSLNCPLWSNDKLLKQQKIIKVLSTQEIIHLVHTS